MERRIMILLILLLREELCKGGCFRGDLECGFGNRDLEDASPVLEVKGRRVGPRRLVQMPKKLSPRQGS